MVEAVCAGFWVVNQLPTVLRDGSLELEIGPVNGRVQGGLFFIGDERMDVVEEHVCGFPGSCKGKGRRHDVLEIDCGVACLSFGDVGSGNDEGYAHAVVVHVLFSHEAVVSNGETVVRGEEDECVFCEARGFKCIDDTPNLGIEMGDEGVVLATVNFHGVFCSGKGSEFFVSQTGPTSYVFLVRIIGLVGPGKGNSLEGIAIEKLARGLSGIVRSVEGDVHEEGFSGAVILFDESHRLLRSDFAPVFTARPVPAEV